MEGCGVQPGYKTAIKKIIPVITTSLTLVVAVVVAIAVRVYRIVIKKTASSSKRTSEMKNILNISPEIKSFITYYWVRDSCTESQNY